MNIWSIRVSTFKVFDKLLNFSISCDLSDVRLHSNSCSIFVKKLYFLHFFLDKINAVLLPCWIFLKKKNTEALCPKNPKRVSFQGFWKNQNSQYNSDRPRYGLLGYNTPSCAIFTKCDDRILRNNHLKTKFYYGISKFRHKLNCRRQTVH